VFEYQDIVSYIVNGEESREIPFHIFMYWNCMLQFSDPL